MIDSDSLRGSFHEIYVVHIQATGFFVFLLKYIADGATITLLRESKFSAIQIMDSARVQKTCTHGTFATRTVSKKIFIFSFAYPGFCDDISYCFW